MVGVFSRQAVIIQFGIWPEWNRSLPTNKNTWSNVFLKFLNKEACLDGESAGWETKSALLWHKLSSYPVNYIRGSCSLCFHQKGQLYWDLPPVALFLFILYNLITLGMMLGLAGVSQTPIVSVGWRLLVAQRLLQNGLACAGPTSLPWQGQQCECLSAGTPPCGVIYNISNYFILQTGLSLFFFCFNRVFSHGNLFCGGCELPCADNPLAWDSWIAGQIFAWKPLRINLHKRVILDRGIQSNVLAVK